MVNTDEKIVDNAKKAGFWLRKGYVDKKAENKLNGICYRLLNAVKTNNQAAFMDTLLNCYLYLQKPVPPVFYNVLKNEEEFKTIALAFIANLIDGKDDIENNKNKGE